MKIYLVHCKVGNDLHIEGAFTSLGEIDYAYGRLGYTRKGMKLYEEGEHRYDIGRTELIGSIRYSGTRQLYDERN